MHGLGGFKEQDHIRVMAEAFEEKGFTVIRFDTTNTLGESEGSYEHATTTNYYEDLEDVIHWAKTREWYREPFALVGHSLGAMCVTLFAEKHPEVVLALAPISPAVSGALRVEASDRNQAGEIKKWKETGWRESESVSKPGFIKRLPWSHMVDGMKYVLIPEARNLVMPVLIIVGDHDDTTPPDHAKRLYDALPGMKEFHIIEDGPHTFRDPRQLLEIKTLFLNWIGSIQPRSK
jgi:pimeloyl-ACP methyl ester carboxylesterase